MTVVRFVTTEVTLEHMASPHISLSRPIVLWQHQIHPFVELLSPLNRSSRSCVGCLRSIFGQCSCFSPSDSQFASANPRFFTMTHAQGWCMHSYGYAELSLFWSPVLLIYCVMSYPSEGFLLCLSVMQPLTSHCTCTVIPLRGFLAVLVCDATPHLSLHMYCHTPQRVSCCACL
jgi:hypothetical protein